MAAPKWNEESRFLKIIHVMSLIFSTGVIIFAVLSIITGFNNEIYIRMTSFYTGAMLICDGIRNFSTNKKWMITFTVLGIFIMIIQFI